MGAICTDCTSSVWWNKTQINQENKANQGFPKLFQSRLRTFAAVFRATIVHPVNN